MGYNLYLMPMLISFSICTLLLLVLIFLSRRKFFGEHRISSRHIHRTGISRFGGVALILSFLVTLYIDQHLVITTALLGVLIGCFAILFLGLWDDIKQLDWKVQLFLQVALVVFVTIMGVNIRYLSNPFGGLIIFPQAIAHILGFFIALVWVVFLMNAMNWSDGIDGLSGGIALIASATIFILSQRPEVNQPPIGIITAALFGCFAAFLLLNFYPAKIMAGTSGSMFMGFIIAILAIFAGAKMATTLLVLVVPALDALWVIFERLKMHKSIFVADKRHLHYRLMELGWSQKSISIFYYLVTMTIALLALNTKAMGKLYSFLLLGIVLLGMLLFIRKKVETLNVN